MKRISQRDIAKRLGVNVSTVSRALRGLDGVSPELKQQIEKLAKEGGYRPNPFATSLRYDTTRTIGIVVPDVSFNQYAHIVKRIEADAREAGYMCIITDTDDSAQAVFFAHLKDGSGTRHRSLYAITTPSGINAASMRE